MENTSVPQANYQIGKAENMHTQKLRTYNIDAQLHWSVNVFGSSFYPRTIMHQTCSG